MAATTIRDLLVRLGVEADTANLKDFNAGLKSVLVGLTAVTAAATGAAIAIFSVTRATAEAGNTAAKTATQIGLTAETYQELVFAAQRAGATSEQLNVALKTLGRQAFDAARGTGEGLIAFERLGISATDASGALKTTEALLSEVSNAFRDLSDEEALALAQKLFGEGGVALIPLLKQGADGIDELRRRARDLGFILDGETAKASEEFTDAMLDAEKALEGVRNTIGAAFLPVFTDLALAFTDAVVFVRPFVQTFLEMIERTIGLETVLAGLAATILAFGSAAASVAGVLGLGALAAAVSSLIGALTALAGVLGVTVGGALAIVLAALVALTAQLALIAAGIASSVALFVGLALVLEDFLTFVRGGNSLIGEFVQRFIESEGPLGSFARMLIQLRDLTLALFDMLMSLADLMLAILMPAFNAVVAALTPVANLLLTILGFLGQLVAFQITSFVDTMTAGLQLVTAAIQTVTGWIDALVSKISGAVQLAGSLAGGLFGGGGGVTNNSTVNNVNATVNAPITTTASAADTAAAVSGGMDSAAEQAFGALAGSEA